MRISDWSSDVCSSDLLPLYLFQHHGGDNLILKKSGLAIGDLMFERYPKVSSHRIRGRYAPPMAENGGLYPLQVACVIHMPHKDRKSTRLNSSHYCAARMPSSA